MIAALVACALVTALASGVLAAVDTARAVAAERAAGPALYVPVSALSPRRL